MQCFRKEQISICFNNDSDNILTNNERVIIDYILGGFTISEVAAITSKSIKTISNQKRTACHKLGVRNDAQLLKALIEWGIVSLKYTDG